MLQLHQGDESVHLGLSGHQRGQDASEPDRLVAQGGTQPVVPRRGRVALVEQQVHDPHDGAEALGPLVTGRLVGHGVDLGQRLLGAGDARRDGGLGRQERPGDLARRQPREEAKRQRHLRVGAERGVAADEHEPQDVVVDVVDGAGDVVHESASLSLGDHGVRGVVPLTTAEAVDRPALGDRHEPGAGVVRHAGRGPLHEGRHEGVLGEVLREADVARHARQRRDEPGRLDPPHGLDRAVEVGAHSCPS
ncbi:MAG: hypothetical protein JWR55_452 [Aeromicrobium sp.]|nr:hypothetical protein [Aeromicrobium sp.]